MIGILLLILSGCRYENAIDLYYHGEDIKPVSSNGLLAHVTFEKKVADISENKTAVSVNGNVLFAKGVDGKDSSAIQLQGYPQCISISNIGINDTLAIFFWFKTDHALAQTDSLTLFDYGVNSFGIQIDGSTGSTYINTIKNEEHSTLADYINSYTTWNYLYAEAGGGKFKVMYQGQTKTKELITIDTENDSPGILNPLADILYIGRSGVAASQNSYFKGSIDNIRVYNRALTKEEVLSLVSEDSKK